MASHLTGSEFQIGSTQAINGIKTVVNNSNSEVPTSKAVLDTFIFPNSGSHNSFYRGKDITSYWTDGTIHSRIQGINGFSLFEDLFVGDYFDAGAYSNIFNNSESKHYYFAIAGFNIRGTFNNVTLLPCSSDGSRINPLYNDIMYDSVPLSNVSGYNNSKANIACSSSDDSLEAGNGTIYIGLNTIFGSNLLQFKVAFTTLMDADYYNRDGRPNGVHAGARAMNVHAVLMSEVEVSGSMMWTSCGMDGKGDSKGQLPIFRLSPEFINAPVIDAPVILWLRNGVSASNFVVVEVNGFNSFPANTNRPATSFAPYFLIN